MFLVRHALVVEYSSKRYAAPAGRNSTKAAHGSGVSGRNQPAHTRLRFSPRLHERFPAPPQHAFDSAHARMLDFALGRAPELGKVHVLCLQATGYTCVCGDQEQRCARTCSYSKAYVWRHLGVIKLPIRAARHHAT